MKTLIVLALSFLLTEASFPENRYNDPDGYFFGTQRLSCVMLNKWGISKWKKSSIPPSRGTWDITHRLIYYRNAVYEFGPKGVDTHDSPVWEAAIKCPIKWESTSASKSKCSVQSLRSFLDGYTTRYGTYSVAGDNIFGAGNNCHKFANRVSAFLFNTNCGKYSLPK